MKARKKKSKTVKRRKSKIPVKEGGESFIRMIKSELAQYPKIGKHFKIIHGGVRYPVTITSIPCIRAGYGIKHKHYHLKINYHELKPGDLIEITKDSERGYLLAIKEFMKKQ